MDTPTRKSRWSYAKHTRGFEIDSPSYERVGRVLGKYTKLTAYDIAAILGVTPDEVNRRCRIMRGEPHGLIKFDSHQEQAHVEYQRKKAIHELTAKGRIKYDATCRPPDVQWLHQLTENQHMASYEIGVKNTGLTLIDLPRAPFRDVTYLDETHDVWPDGWPRQIVYPDGSYRFIVTETDCDSEDLTISKRTARKHKKSLESMFAAYLAMLDHELYYKQFKMENCFILTTVTGPQRMKNAIAMLTQLAGARGRSFLPVFGFQVFPTFRSYEPQPPHGFAIKQQWQTPVGILDLSKP